MTKTSTRIRIVDGYGKPVSEATATVIRSSTPFPEIALLSNLDGILEVMLPPGEFTFRFIRPSGQQCDATVTIPDDAQNVLNVIIQ